MILEAHTATVDWGDGAVEPGAVVEANGVGTVTGSHTYAAEGTYLVTVTVRDAAGNASADTFTVTVVNASRRQPPIDVVSSDPAVTVVNRTGPLAGIGPNQTAAFDVELTGTPGPRRFDLRFVRPATGVLLGTIPVTVNETYRYAVEALDGDGDPVTFRMVSGPPGAAITPAGVLTFTPAAPGTYAFVVEAADGRSGVDTQAYTLTVTAGANANPAVAPTEPDRAVVFRDFTYRVAATDPDGDPLSFFLSQPPAGMAIDAATGVVSWRPTRSQLGTHAVTVTVTDSRGGRAVHEFPLVVTEDLANQPPAVTSTPPADADPGVLYRYLVQPPSTSCASRRWHLS